MNSFHRLLMLGLLLCSIPARAQKIHLALKGDNFIDEFGYSVGAAGDVNADGIPDLIVGAPQGAFCPGGYVRVFSGKDGQILLTSYGDCNDLNGQSDWFGMAVGAVGDVDGDGFPEVIGGSPADDPVGLDSGSATILRGTGGVLRRMSGTPGDSSLFGKAVIGTGDVNRDGVPDVAVGAPQDDSATASAGKVFLFSGIDGVLIDSIEGTSVSEELGWSLARVRQPRGGANDDVLHGDGIDEFVVGARRLFGLMGSPCSCPGPIARISSSSRVPTRAMASAPPSLRPATSMEMAFPVCVTGTLYCGGGSDVTCFVALGRHPQ